MRIREWGIRAPRGLEAENNLPSQIHMERKSGKKLGSGRGAFRRRGVRLAWRSSALQHCQRRARGRRLLGWSVHEHCGEPERYNDSERSQEPKDQHPTFRSPCGKDVESKCDSSCRRSKSLKNKGNRGAASACSCAGGKHRCRIDAFRARLNWPLHLFDPNRAVPGSQLERAAATVQLPTDGRAAQRTGDGDWKV
jgi:hypothetical protein